MKKIYSFFILYFFSILSFSQTKYYNFPLIEGTKMVSMKNANTFVLSSNGLLANSIFSDKNKTIYNYTSLFITSLLLQPITHEEGHRSVLTELNIGAISQPIFDKNMVAKVTGVTDTTLKNLRDTNLPSYIRLHTAGLESDFTYLNSLNSKLSFEEGNTSILKEIF